MFNPRCGDLETQGKKPYHKTPPWDVGKMSRG